MPLFNNKQHGQSMPIKPIQMLYINRRNKILEDEDSLHNNRFSALPA